MSEVDRKPWQLSLLPSYGFGESPDHDVVTVQDLAGVGVSLSRDLVDTGFVVAPRFDLSYYISWADRTGFHVDEAERISHRVTPMAGLELGLGINDEPCTSIVGYFGSINAFFLAGPEFFPGQDVGGDIGDKIAMKGGLAINMLDTERWGVSVELGGRSMYNPISKDAQLGPYMAMGLAHRM